MAQDIDDAGRVGAFPTGDTNGFNDYDEDRSRSSSGGPSFPPSSPPSALPPPLPPGRAGVAVR